MSRPITGTASGARRVLRAAAAALLCAGVATVAIGCRAQRDLSDAVDGGIGRRVTDPAIVDTSLGWIEVRRPAGKASFFSGAPSVCWLGDSLVVGGGRRIDLFDAAGRFARDLSDAAGRRAWPHFRAIGQVRCAPTERRLLVVDTDKRRIHFLDLDAGTSWMRAAPSMPQDVPYVGELALGDGSLWWNSWLGSRVGPYLTGTAWDSVPLVEIWRDSATRSIPAGSTTPYRLPATRRVFNHVNLSAGRDTVWVLTQANAAIRAFTADGASVGNPLFLPIYQRGMEPMVEVGPKLLDNGLRHNRVIYEPSVGGLAIPDPDHFAVLRFRDWERITRSTPNGDFQDIWPTSLVELIDRSGRPTVSIRVPGRARSIAANGAGKLAVVTEESTGALHVLVGQFLTSRVRTVGTGAREHGVSVVIRKQ